MVATPNPKPKRRSATLTRVHQTPLAVDTLEMSPPHPPRVETPEYERAHHFLIYTKNSPCAVCGVTRRTLKNPKKNLYHATQLESHHFPVARSLIDACEPRRLHVDFPQVYDTATMLQWVDSPANLIILCDYHHRSTEAGIHHLVTQDFSILKYLKLGYRVAATRTDAATAQATDDAIMQAAGLEPTSASTAPTPQPVA